MLKTFKNTKIYQIFAGLLLGIILTQFDIGKTILLLLIILVIVYARKFYLLFIFALIIGSLYTFYWESLFSKDIHNFENKEVQITGEIIQDPNVKDYYSEIVFKPQTNFSTNIITELSKYNNLKTGDEITVKGTLNIPEQYENFDRLLYLKSRNISLELKNPEVIQVQSYQYKFESLLSKVNHSISQIISENLTEPQTSLDKGLIIGDDNGFSDELKNNIKNSGLSHITSVSGYNVGIIFIGLLYFTKFINRKITLLIAGILIFLFWNLVGFYNLPTARASIMLLIIIASILIGRRLDPIYAITLSTIILLVLCPFYLFNISFQLSLLASLALFLLAGKLIKILEKIRVKNLLTEILITTISVLIFTLPLTYLQFGSISILAIIANIVILPLIPLITVLSISAILLQILNITLLSHQLFMIINNLLKLVILFINKVGSLEISQSSDSRIALIYFIAILTPVILLLIYNKKKTANYKLTSKNE